MRRTFLTALLVAAFAAVVFVPAQAAAPLPGEETAATNLGTPAGGPGVQANASEVQIFTSATDGSPSSAELSASAYGSATMTVSIREVTTLGDTYAYLGSTIASGTITLSWSDAVKRVSFASATEPLIKGQKYALLLYDSFGVSTNPYWSVVDGYTTDSYAGGWTGYTTTASLNNLVYSDGYPHDFVFAVYTTPIPSDTTAPVITVPADMTQQIEGVSSATVTFTASATDDVDGTVAVTCEPASGATFEYGTTTVSCSATDAAGNTAANPSR